MICQACSSDNLEEVLDLGQQPLCNDFRDLDQAGMPQTYHPLCLCYCHDCTLVQLNYVLPTSVTFGDQYTYLTGSSPSLIRYYSDLAEEITNQFNLVSGDLILEIGSNDGTFLKAFKALGMEVIGIEGAKQSVELACKSEIPTIEQFFGTGTSGDIRKRLPNRKNIRLILAMNVLAHTDNIGEVLDEIKMLMDDNTVLISSNHWLIELIRKCEFDTIYHEHLRYYTLGSLEKLFERHGLHIYDGLVTDFYGGSILTYATIEPHPKTSQLNKILSEESQVDVVSSLKHMKIDLIQNKSKLLDLLVNLKLDGKRVVGIGAPMKASTLLNFYGITPDLMDSIAEVNELKIGTMVPGVRIPVVDEVALLNQEPDYSVLLSWNMAQPIIRNYRAMGYKGRFIMPVPRPEVIDE